METMALLNTLFNIVMHKKLVVAPWFKHLNIPVFQEFQE